MRHRDARGQGLHLRTEVVRTADIRKSPGRPLSELPRGVVRTLLVDGLRVWVRWPADDTEQLVPAATVVALPAVSEVNGQTS